MSNKSCVILAAVLLCSGPPAQSQELPDGPGKELAVANCNGCHTLLSRVGAGYTPEGSRTVLRLMLNQGGPLPADQVEPLRESALLAQTKSFDNLAIPIRVATVQIVQQPAPLADHHDQPAPRSMIFGVGPEVGSEIVDALAQQRNLHLRRSGIFRVRSELLD